MTVIDANKNDAGQITRQSKEMIFSIGISNQDKEVSYKVYPHRVVFGVGDLRLTLQKGENKVLEIIPKNSSMAIFNDGHEFTESQKCAIKSMLAFTAYVAGANGFKTPEEIRCKVGDVTELPYKLLSTTKSYAIKYDNRQWEVEYFKWAKKGSGKFTVSVMEHGGMRELIIFTYKNEFGIFTFDEPYCAIGVDRSRSQAANNEMHKATDILKSVIEVIEKKGTVKFSTPPYPGSNVYGSSKPETRDMAAKIRR